MTKAVLGRSTDDLLMGKQLIAQAFKGNPQVRAAA
jgi:hypothetical protein